MTGSVTPRSTTTVPPPPTSPFASPPTRLRCRRMRSPAPSTASISPAIRMPPSGLPTSSGRWRRRDHGRNAKRLRARDFGIVIQLSAVSGQASSFPGDTRNSERTQGDGRTGQLPFRLPFWLRSACRAQNTSALRTHALLPDIRSAPFRCGLLPRGKLGSLSTNLFHSPWE